MPSDPRITPLSMAIPTIGRLGNYDLLHRIALGGMGEVYLARQRGPSAFSRYVVLKKLHAQLTQDAHFVEMFLNEAQIAANLSHPNIAHIYELFEDGDKGYVIAMEYVRGGTVLSLLRERSRGGTKGGLPVGTVVRIASAVCDALHYAYFEPGPDGEPRRVIHRDVSPSNVIVGFDGQVKLVDFGIAKALATEGLTQATTLKGKYGYMSPEQIKSKPLDHRTDIFSLGTMMWEMFTGRRLFKRDGDMQMLYSILEEPIQAPSEIVKDLPPAVDSIVMKALARAREERWDDAAQMAQALRGVAQNNDWDVEASTMSRFVRDMIPDELVALSSPTVVDGIPSGTGSDSHRGKGPTAGPQESPDDEPKIEIGPSHPPAPAQAGISNAFVLAVLVMVLISSAVFWIVIVPTI
jgi:serine/threonine-protein kinase